jgi:hypothetical protein
MGIILGGILPAVSVNKMQKLKREIKLLRQMHAERYQALEKQIADLTLKKDDLEKKLEEALQVVEVSEHRASNSEQLEKSWKLLYMTLNSQIRELRFRSKNLNNLKKKRMN